ncbi:unnamed protein product [Nippostrongylus brasiliensis]|uniref:Enolase-phosphatase E1 (inferred by orthology to a C. elegans protein) n=1 Tax=Nippostrongylus brasiliensis TaxID=27835 RepID=A0A0N4XDX2_NIPBR|nr:unnamed protein product [Nippostrongylus brasiliensis]
MEELVRSTKEEYIDDVCHNVRYWITIDKKVTAMKALQGLIWEEAYAQGAVKGHVYPDVLPVLQSLTVPIYIYSSGSILAQKLLFAHTIDGDLRKVISGYFDTSIGFKGDKKSYEAICNEIGESPADVLFLTDVEAEARAADAAGVQVRLVIREGNAPLSEEAKRDYETIHSLEEIV